MNQFAARLFKYRSYTPIPFLIIMLVFHNSSAWSLAVGFLIALAGEALRLWGVSWTGSETRTTGHTGGTFLIISGPFAFVRNPLYIGNIFMYLGLGIMSFALFPYLQIIAILYFFIQYYFIIKIEEQFLLEKFGKDYSDYKKNVHAIIPGLTPYKNPAVVQPAFNLKAGLRSEKRSLQAFLGTSLIIFLIWLIKVYY